MCMTLKINLADILKDKYPNGIHADIDISNFMEFADDYYTHELNIDDMLADKQMIGIFWNIQLVLAERPDLTHDQAWSVLRNCKICFEEMDDSIREIVRSQAAKIPQPTGKAAFRQQLAQLQEEFQLQIEALPEEKCTYPAAYGRVQALLDTVKTLAKGTAV